MSETPYEYFSKIKKLFEGSRVPGLDYETKYKSKKDPTITSIRLNLQGKNSEIATKLIHQYARAQYLEGAAKKRRDALNEKIKQRFSEIFDAGDEVYTRYIETLGAIVTLSAKGKDEIIPASKTESKDFEKIANELIALLEGDLLKRAEEIVKLYTKVNEVPERTIPADEPKLRFKVKDKQKDADLAKESTMNEDVEDSADKLKDYGKRYLDLIASWGPKFDEKINRIKQEIEQL